MMKTTSNLIALAGQGTATFPTDSQVSEATASTSQQLSKVAKKPGQDYPMSPEAPARNEKEEQGISGNTRSE